MASRIQILGSTAACLTLFLLCSACGTAQVDNGASLQRSSTDHDAVDAQVTALYSRIYGDADERSAAAFLTNYEANQSTQQCMADRGLRFTIVVVNQWTDWTPTDGLDGNRFLAPLSGSPVSTSVLSTAASARAIQNVMLNDTTGELDQPGYREAIAACTEGAAVDGPGAIPQIADTLLADFHSAVDEVDAQLADYEGPYRDCMENLGYPDLGGFSDLFDRLLGDVPRAEDIPVGSEEPTEAGNAFLNKESDAMAADGGCRSEAYEAGTELLPAMVATFDSTHEAELAQADDAWQTVVQQASSNGWDPDILVQSFPSS
jgi:hypothetical protein